MNVYTLDKDQKGFGVIEGLVVIAVVASIGLAGWFVYHQSQNKSTKTASSNSENAAQKDITASIDQNSYQKFENLTGITFWMPKAWTAGSPAKTLVSVFNYNPDTVKAELLSDGRYPSNIQEYHDVAVRKLKTYPYSLDNMYEVQVMFLTLPIDNPGGDSSVTDMQQYKVNGIPITDYIQKGQAGFLDQRIILVKNHDGSKEVRITLNPSESNNKVTKNNFDGLLQLVGSIRFSG